MPAQDAVALVWRGVSYAAAGGAAITRKPLSRRPCWMRFHMKAGANIVMARSAFSQNLQQILKRHAGVV